MDHGSNLTKSAACRTWDAVDIARILVGLFWLGGAIFNALVTIRMTNPFGWLASGARLNVWRWFFGTVVGRNPTMWTGLLVVTESALGVLTLSKGSRAKFGLSGGALFSTVLFSFGSPYTLVMGPYALILAWLGRHEFRRSLIFHLRTVIAGAQPERNRGCSIRQPGVSLRPW